MHNLRNIQQTISGLYNLGTYNKYTSGQTHLPSLPSKGEAAVGEQVEGRAQLVLQVAALLNHSQPAPPGCCQLDIAYHPPCLRQSTGLLLLFLQRGSGRSRALLSKSQTDCTWHMMTCHKMHTAWPMLRASAEHCKQ